MAESFDAVKRDPVVAAVTEAIQAADSLAGADSPIDATSPEAARPRLPNFTRPVHVVAPGATPVSEVMPMMMFSRQWSPTTSMCSLLDWCTECPADITPQEEDPVFIRHSPFACTQDGPITAEREMGHGMPAVTPLFSLSAPRVPAAVPLDDIIRDPVAAAVAEAVQAAASPAEASSPEVARPRLPNFTRPPHAAAPGASPVCKEVPVQMMPNHTPQHWAPSMSMRSLLNWCTECPGVTTPKSEDPFSLRSARAVLQVCA